MPVSISITMYSSMCVFFNDTNVKDLSYPIIFIYKGRSDVMNWRVFILQVFFNPRAIFVEHLYFVSKI